MRAVRIGAVLLAAGESKRMGPANKLAVPVGGAPLLRRSALVLLGAALEEIVVVLGHEAESAAGMLADLPLRAVVNADYRAGRQRSVHLGLESLERPCDAVMICLADQPLLTSADIDALIHAYRHQCPRPILVPGFDGRRGNPVIISAEQRAAVLASAGRLSCRDLIAANPDLVWHYPGANDHYCVDLDTPEDRQRLAGRLAAAAGAGPP